MEKQTLQNATELTCPECASKKLHRSRRRGFWERIILYQLGYRPYRCEDCDKRFRSKSNSPIAPTDEEDNPA
jgi:DNA-directed RNA polymerase subunit RPC12/RpoP